MKIEDVFLIKSYSCIHNIYYIGPRCSKIKLYWAQNWKLCMKIENLKIINQQMNGTCQM